jgi:hypothetical protein
MQGITGDDLRALAIGISGSIGAWYVLQRVRVRYRWSAHIAEAPGDEPGRAWRYSVKVLRLRRRPWPGRYGPGARRERTASRHRRLLDARFHIEFRVRGLFGRGPENLRTIPVPTRDWLPILNTYQIPVIEPWRIDARAMERLPSKIALLFQAGTVRDLLEHAEDGVTIALRAYVVGYDSFSGTRCVYASPEYTAASIKRGRFAPDGLDVIPLPMANEPVLYGDD